MGPIPWAGLLSAAGTILSGGLSKFNNDRMERQQKAEDARRKAFYAGKAAESPLASSQNQQMLGEYDRRSAQQLANATGVGLITGATPEFSLGVQKGIAEGRADMMGKMGADATRRKDMYEMMGEQAKQEAHQAEMERLANRDNTFANLAANSANALGTLVDGYSGMAKAPEANANGTTESAGAKMDTGKPANIPLRGGAANLGGGTMVDANGNVYNKHNPISSIGANYDPFPYAEYDRSGIRKMITGKPTK